MSAYDIAIVGAGMAGASLAVELAPHARVLLLEAEAQPGYHATGRSAAFWSETYGGPAIQPLTTASGPWLADPPHTFADTGFLHRRGALHIAADADRDLLAGFAAEFAGSGVQLDPLGRAALVELLPGLAPHWNAGLAEPSCADIDVAGLHAGYLAAARRAGAELRCAAPARAIDRQGGGWRIVTPDDTVDATIVVDAAGAWADGVARIAGVRPLGITPYRRTVVQILVDPPASPDLPLVIDAAGSFYFKPEAGGRLWLSPHDETAAPAGDAAPEELDIAIAIDRLGAALDWRVTRVERRWAGLRSFAPDRVPVYGWDVRAPGFFWFAGQGGFGIQTAPAAAQLAAAVLLGQAPPPLAAAIDPARYAPQRLG